MPMKTSGLYNQYTVHLLAKLMNKLLTSSNLIVIGNKVACPSHLKTLINDIPKSDHGLTREAINNKDKQNYASITLLIDEKVEQCLKQLDCKFNTQGTIVCLSIMRKIRDATFNKAISPLKRIYLYGIQYIFFVYGVRIC